ncbi:hypothetical protein ABZ543_02185 [Streptomyces roseifaciens]
MQLKWARPGILRVTSHVHEFSALIAAARQVTESASPEIGEKALDRLKEVLRSYDAQAARLHGNPPERNPQE